MNDAQLHNLVHRISGSHTYAFTLNQFCAAHARWQRDRRRTRAMAALLLAAALAAAGLTAWFVSKSLVQTAVLASAAAALAAVGLWRMRHSRAPDPQAFGQLIHRRPADDPLFGEMIVEPALHAPLPTGPDSAFDRAHFDRLLIVERDELVDLFVRNQFHAEQRTLVIAESGYPPSLLPLAQDLLVDQPDLPVFLLHDATPHRPPMRERIEQAGRLPIAGHPVVDLGWSSADVAKLPWVTGVVGESVPVDLLAYGTLSTGLAAAMAEGVPLADLLARTSVTGAGPWSDYLMN